MAGPDYDEEELTPEEAARLRAEAEGYDEVPVTADEAQLLGASSPPASASKKSPPLVGWSGAREAAALRGVDNIPAGGLISDILATSLLQSATSTGQKFPNLSRGLAGAAAKAPYIGKYLPAPVAGAGATLTPQAQAELYALVRDKPELAKELGIDVEGIADPGVPESGPLDTYREVRDTRRERTEEAKNSQDPLVKWGGMAGAATGFTSSLLAPLPSVKVGAIGTGLLGAKGAAIAGNIASGAATGGAYGALSGAADGDADLTRGDVRGFGRDVAGAGAGGVALGTVAAGGAEALRPLWKYIRSMALNQGGKVLQGGSDIAAATRKPLSDESIEEVLKSKGIRPFSTTQATHERVSDLAAESGDLYGRIVSELEANGVKGAEVRQLADDLYARAQQEFAASGSNKAVSQQFTKEGRNLENLARGAGPDAPRATGPAVEQLGLKQTEGIKQTLQRQARLDMLTQKPTDEALAEIASKVRQANEDAVEAAGAQAHPRSEVRHLADAFVPVKQRTGRLLEARGFTEKAATKAAQRGNVSLKDYMVGMAAGDPASALATALVSGLARNRVPSATAAYGYRLSEAMRSGSASPDLARMVQIALNPDADDMEALVEALRRRKDTK